MAQRAQPAKVAIAHSAQQPRVAIAKERDVLNLDTKKLLSSDTAKTKICYDPTWRYTSNDPLLFNKFKQYMASQPLPVDNVVETSQMHFKAFTSKEKDDEKSTIKYLNLDSGKCVKVTTAAKKHHSETYRVCGSNEAYVKGFEIFLLSKFPEILPDAKQLRASYKQYQLEFSGKQDVTEAKAVEVAQEGQRTSARKKEVIPDILRKEVWVAHSRGKVDDMCFCCDKLLTIDKFICSHIVSEDHGGAVTHDNLRPTCKECSSTMSTMHMYEFIMANNLPGKSRLFERDRIFWAKWITRSKQIVLLLDQLKKELAISVEKRKELERDLNDKKLLSVRKAAMLEVIRLYTESL